MEEFFPDHSPISSWFYEIPKLDIEKEARQYLATDYGIVMDGSLQTKGLQKLIDEIHGNGGGVLVLPPGEVMSGALYLKQGVDLYLSKKAVLVGSPWISDFPVEETRMEGENCLYFPALINAKGLHGVRIFGEGCVDGRGLHYWKEFWIRRSWNPSCTNKDAQRPRLFFADHCEDVVVCGITMKDSPFWTNHLYQCRYVKFIGCTITSPHEPVKAPSTDGIDLDVCQDVLIKNCYIAVNDDAVVCKGGKGPWADEDPCNGSNERILIEDCTFGFCHGCLTLGSESIHNRNILMRRVKVEESFNLLWCKLRPDTPQIYECIRLEEIQGKTANFLNINPWRQFFDDRGRKDIPRSKVLKVSFENCRMECDTFLNVLKDEEQYELSEFSFSSLRMIAAKTGASYEVLGESLVEDVMIEPKDEIAFPDSITTI
ncbi:MAG: exopolygalacturonase [Lachnospiraceae bacterium]|nr:exopolygalacturonase [Lachnospiraceae bacterium]